MKFWPTRALTINIDTDCVHSSRFPNNPDGSKRSPLVQDPERVIMDMVYYWPMYTDIDEKVNKSIMVFSR